MRRTTNPRKFFTGDETAAIESTIAEVERKTSAEIKLIVLRHCWTNLLEKGRRLFFKHELHKTQRRNVVMILLVLANHELLIFGDKGIDECMEEGFWVSVKNHVLERFKTGAFGDGVCEGVRRVGSRLVEHFPIGANDRNEVSDEVVHED